ncbi:MAG TPA: hypothetical protein VFX96_12670 [Pyrinomonadaceae bacterium]|nr:hypothetical protein [Pyrinomonadaceae bacterium]
MTKILRALRSVAAVMVGYVTMVVLITLVQETLFGGVSLQKSSPGVLVAAGAGTFLAAVVGGAVAGLIAPARPQLHALAMCVMVVIETSYLVATGRVGGPLWFDLMAAGSLVVGIILGASLVALRRQRAKVMAR